ncbi:MAG: hypothetical protein JNM98_06075 [Rhodocyclaceae bacterium]|nr:hypothetical protein [Rhodocyclaceae bacterium]
MSQITQDRDTRSADSNLSFDQPVAANQILFAGTLAEFNASGYIVPATAAAGHRCAGWSAYHVDSTGMADGQYITAINRQPAAFASGAGADAITQADAGLACYVIDNQTVGKTDGAAHDRPRAGKILRVDVDGVWVDFIG